ncbi:MAG: hypothetical protein KGR25_10480 [Chloroflexi bacterium]|nr:hypothetical protein [Chloroflexota bacterium]
MEGLALDAYLPDLEQLPDGAIIEDYGRAHARRQADAEQALSELADLDAATVLWVMDGDRAVAKVYRTKADGALRYVVQIQTSRRSTPDLHGLNKRQGRLGAMRITTAGVVLCDPLDATEDRDLEVTNSRGLLRLDRCRLLERIGFGQAKASIDEVAAD